MESYQINYWFRSTNPLFKLIKDRTLLVPEISASYLYVPMDNILRENG